jgi:chromosome segregation ATPase
MREAATGAMTPRIDPAHPSGREPASRPARLDDEVAEAVAGQSARHAQVQLQQQAADLARHLRSRQRDLARWEATLNARLAQLEDEQRSARLWLRERQTELEQRATALQRETRQLAERGADIESLRATHERELESVKRQAAWLDAARSDWERQRAREQEALRELEDRLHQQRLAAQQRDAQLKRQLQQLQQDTSERQRLCAREQELETLLATLRHHAATLGQEREEFERQKAAWWEKHQRQRQALAQRWRQRRLLLRKRAKTVQELADGTECTRQTLDTMRNEMVQRHREMLETCLTLEWAWQQLAGRIPPDVLSQAAASTRARLTDELAAQDRMRMEQQGELERLAEEIARQRRDLARQREELQRWTASHQAELDEQFEQLASRERAVAARERQCEDARRMWLRYGVAKKERPAIEDAP